MSAAGRGDAAPMSAPEAALLLVLAPLTSTAWLGLLSAHAGRLMPRLALAAGVADLIAAVGAAPVHLVYRTAFTEPKGRTQFRRDIYGRDARIWEQMQNAGVSLRAVQG